MVVLKFGGSSVANSNNIKLVCDIIAQESDKQKIVVVSALGGTTDLLINCGELAAAGDRDYETVLAKIKQRHIETVQSLLPASNQSSCLSTIMQSCNELEGVCEGVYRLGELSVRSLDRIVSYGELLSSKIISGYLSTLKIEHTWLDSRKLLKTDNLFGNANVNFAVTYQKIQDAIQSHSTQIFIAPGFIASTQNDITTTLGRGGSDYTAAIYAAAINAEALEIWTDVSGMMTADPRWVPNARPLERLSYQEAMELSHFGAKVIYPPTLQPAMQLKIPLWIKNTFDPQAPGTVIQHEVSNKRNIISGISSLSNICLVSLEGSGMVGIPGFSRRLFEALANKNINVILITQGSSEHSICVGIHSKDAATAEKALLETFETEIAASRLDPIAIENDLSIVALVGDDMKSHQGISGQMFGALGKNGINIRAIAQGSSERNISAVITTNDVKKAVNVLHEAFFEKVRKQLNVFVIGVGNVGGKLINQILHQTPYLLEQLNMQLTVIGLSNSKKMVFEADGIDLTNWKELLANGEAQTLGVLAEKLINLNLRNCVFVDITSNADVANMYSSLFRKSISVVACNKIAASDKYEKYIKLRQLARSYNTSFLFETNVGAALPVIGTVNDLVRSGDKVNKILAVLSGTLNFVFNNYDGTSTFAEVVKQAQNEGYTEPDPRLDLGGVDVMRKILILAREAGYHLEMEDIINDTFLPASCMQGSVEDFYKELLVHEAHFKALFEKAKAENCKLKFVAEFSETGTAVGLQHIPGDHDFYHLYGKDNIVLYYTNRYCEQPMVIKGAGAGADVTAAGVFADIMRVVSQ